MKLEDIKEWGFKEKKRILEFRREGFNKYKIMAI